MYLRTARTVDNTLLPAVHCVFEGDNLVDMSQGGSALGAKAGVTFMTC